MVGRPSSDLTIDLRPAFRAIPTRGDALYAIGRPTKIDMREYRAEVAMLAGSTWAALKGRSRR